jgi:hypothetical protein
MGVNFQICVREVVWMVYNSRKPMNFCNILYYLKVIFLHCIFEALNSVFIYSKTLRIDYTKVHFVFLAQMKESKESFLMV